ncbi:MAG TPA: hypothetical protein VNN17_01485, partial [Terriglobia bacterium]|nr:hypothetical protein [Terriglobia bacterium]
MNIPRAVAMWNLGIGLAAALLGAAALARAQGSVPLEVGQHGYADSIFVNGKIVSMEDQGYNNNPGRIYEAMAVKGGRIIALNTTAYIRTLAGPSTQVYDLGGMTVIPGLIDTHNHNFGGQVGPTMGIRAPNNGIQVRVEAGRDMEATRLRVENAIRDSLTKVNPGEWISVGIGENEQEGISANRIFSWVVRGELEPKDRLTRLAPNNPVIVQQASRATMN